MEQVLYIFKYIPWRGHIILVMITLRDIFFNKHHTL